MPVTPNKTLLTHVLLAALCCGVASAQEGDSRNERERFFENRIRPVLVEHCYACHGEDPDDISNGLDLTTAAGLRKGGISGRAIIPGQPRRSLLVLAVMHSEPDLQMPADRLPQNVIRDFEKWVRDGAIDPRGDAKPAVAKDPVAEYDYSKGRKHWAWQPIRKPDPPAIQSVQFEQQELSPIDRFIFARHEREKLERNEPASRRQLIRRVTFDLKGLPPTPSEIDDFVQDTSPKAFEKVVDRLLASPRYGERYGRHWLDVVRYADSNGGDDNIGYQNSFRYRDYVIRSFNDDKPFDRFVHEQLAGDLLDDFADNSERFEAITATGFWMVGSKVLDVKDHEARSLNIIAEQLEVMGTAFIGHHIGCARCHDHKFDPIPTRDYYALAGILKSSLVMDKVDQLGHLMIRQPLATQLELDEYAKARALIDAVQRKHDATVNGANERTRRRRLAAMAENMLVAERLRRRDVSREDVAKETRFNLRHIVTLRDFIDPNRKDMKSVFAVWRAYSDAFRTDKNLSAEGRAALAKSLVEGASREPGSISMYALETLKPKPPGSLEELAKRYQRLFERIDASLDDHLEFYAMRSALESLWKNAEHLHVGVADVRQRLRNIETGAKTQLKTLEPIAAKLLKDGGDGIQKAVRSLREKLNEAILLQAEALQHIDAERGDEANERIRRVFDTLREAKDRVYRLPEARVERLDVFVDLVKFDNISRALRSPHDSPFGFDAEFESQFHDAETKSKIAKLAARIDELNRRSPPKPAWALAIKDKDDIVDLPVHFRGSHLTQHETLVPRGFLRVTDHLFESGQPADNQSGRLKLANWITHPKHPLTARVLANRVWQWHFGRGLVNTPNDFGFRGGEPSHPKLLDYLAARVLELDWSVKKLHREILLTRTYQLSSAHKESAFQRDPDNQLLWRMSPRRLEAEAIRDAMLFVNGKLDLRMFGRDESYNPGRSELDRFVFRRGATWGERDKLWAAPRRSIYHPVIRSAINPMLSTFDYVDASSSVGKRPSTTVAPQALLMMNSPFVMKQAEAFAERLLDHVTDEEACIDSAFVRSYGRAPTDDERDDSREFLHAVGVTENRQAAWARLCHVLFANSEFINVD